MCKSAICLFVYFVLFFFLLLYLFCVIFFLFCVFYLQLRTSAIFRTRANVLDLKELFMRDVIICKVAGKLSLSILAGIFSKPGALLDPVYMEWGTPV